MSDELWKRQEIESPCVKICVVHPTERICIGCHRSVEEIAFVEPAELASIEGFDEDTAAEIQNRAREYLERIEAERDARRKELGVEDEVREIPGITTAMMVALGEDGVKSVEDFAGYAVDDLVGWRERKDGETKFFDGVFSPFDVTRADAEQMVMSARLMAGWVTEEDLAGDEEADAEDEAEAAVSEA